MSKGSDLFKALMSGKQTPDPMQTPLGVQDNVDDGYPVLLEVLEPLKKIGNLMRAFAGDAAEVMSRSRADTPYGSTALSTAAYLSASDPKEWRQKYGLKPPPGVSRYHSLRVNRMLSTYTPLPKSSDGAAQLAVVGISDGSWALNPAYMYGESASIATLRNAKRDDLAALGSVTIGASTKASRAYSIDDLYKPNSVVLSDLSNWSSPLSFTGKVLSKDGVISGTEFIAATKLSAKEQVAAIGDMPGLIFIHGNGNEVILGAVQAAMMVSVWMRHRQEVPAFYGTGPEFGIQGEPPKKWGPGRYSLSPVLCLNSRWYTDMLWGGGRNQALTAEDYLGIIMPLRGNNA